MQGPRMASASQNYTLTSAETLYKFQTAWPTFQPPPPILG